MMIRIATTAVLALAWAITAGSAGAVGPTAAECIDETIDALQRRYESIADFRADFVQTTRTVALAGAPGDDTARGTVVFAKPAKMRWAYTSPEPSLTVSDGETLWVYDPARAEVQRMSGIRGYFSGAAVQFLLGEGDVRRDFDITALTCTAENGELELVPRADASYEKLRILVDRATGELRRSTVIDLLGNVTQVEFSDVRANQQPDDGVFRFTPPDGVEVIDLDVR
jgi:outer membrane lipoprotein carrier protein